MSTDTPPQKARPFANLRGPWTAVAGIAALAVFMGLLLPRLVSSEPVLDKEHPKPDAKGVTGAEYKAPSLPEAPNASALLGRLVMGTFVVLGLAVMSIWAMRRWLPAQKPINAAPRELKLIETLHLGQRTSLHLVHLGQREILVGVDASGIKSIVPLQKPFEVEALDDTQPGDAAAEPEPVKLPRLAAWGGPSA